MCSDRKRQANRVNALKSTGPKTAEGKAVSSRNATKHGLTAQSAVVLEEEMMKMSDARMNYDAAISFYQKSLGLLRMASRAPGK